MIRRDFLAGGFALAMLAGWTGMPVNLAAAQSSGSQTKVKQAGNQAYEFANANPAYSGEKRPALRIHRLVSPYVQRGSFDPFATLAGSDGFQTDWLDKPLTAEILQSTDLLVVANAYTKGGQLDFRNFGTLDAPSVYNKDEIKLIVNWVREGGGLLILADHSPFAGGAIKLAEAFGFTFMTGFAIHNSSGVNNIKTEVDFRKDGTKATQVGALASHPITEGGQGRDPVDNFFTFGGQAIIPPGEAQNLLTLPTGFETLLTLSLRGDFGSAPRLDASGLSQGAVLEFGKGRVAVFGETGAFTSQILSSGSQFGFESPGAPHNEEFVLSVLRWLMRYQP